MDSNMPFPQRAANKSKKGRNNDIDETISRILQQSKLKYTLQHVLSMLSKLAVYLEREITSKRAIASQIKMKNLDDSANVPEITLIVVVGQQWFLLQAEGLLRSN